MRRLFITALLCGLTAPEEETDERKAGNPRSDLHHVAREVLTLHRFGPVAKVGHDLAWRSLEERPLDLPALPGGLELVEVHFQVPM